MLLERLPEGLLEKVRAQSRTDSQTTREAFHRPRSGLFTASEVHKLLTTKVVRADNATARQYIFEKAFERITGHWAKDGGAFKETDWGNENEAAMIAAFEDASGGKVLQTQVFKKAIDAPFGATLDGITDDGGILEGKCPYNGGIHLQNLANCHSAEWMRVNRFDYYVQCQAAMWASDTSHCWFVSYDPGTTRDRDSFERTEFEGFEKYRIGYWELGRNETFISALRDVVMEAEKDLQKIIEGLEIPF